MKIGIITIHNSTNYGACLQSWALYKFLLDSGYDCEIIDLHRPVHADYKYSKVYVDYYGAGKKANAFNIKRFIKKLLKGKSVPDYMRVRNDKFQSFNSQIKLSRPYRSIDELYDTPPSYDVYLTGSDQVWNPQQPFCIEPYFLTFVTSTPSKKISYAASVGIEQLTENQKEDFKSWLDSYSSISVREDEAKLLLESFINKPVCRVADPTFLIDRKVWKDMARRPMISEPYILCFKLYSGNHLVDYAIQLGKQSGKKVLVIPSGNELSGCEVVRDAGPEDFLGYIADADLLISDSYHANVFGLLLGSKNQMAYIKPGNQRGSRLITLYKMFSMDDHFISPDLSTTYDEIVCKKKDEGYISIKIEEEKKQSRLYLLNSIEK